MLVPSYATPHRGASIHGRPFGEFDAGQRVGDRRQPYTRAGHAVSWWRARMLGGRTNHWGRISLRFGPDDFRRKSLDGLGDDWPISYDDVKPYYDNVDRFIGLYGSNEGLRNAPDGIFMPPPKPRCHELLVKKASDKLNVTCIPARLSIITQPLNGRMACHYCGQCNRGCQVKANFSSGDVLVAPALATGKLTLITNAMAREVTVGPDGLANGFSYINKNNGAEGATTSLAPLVESQRVAELLTGKIRPKILEQLLAERGIKPTDAGVSPGHIPRSRTTFRNHDASAECTQTCRGARQLELDFPHTIEVYGGAGQPSGPARNPAAQRRRVRALKADIAHYGVDRV
jgi:choline dehydrogenase-like flavoprotein